MSKLANSKTLSWLGLAPIVVLAIVVGLTYKPETKAASLWPETPPAQICGSAILNGGPTTAPAGAIVVPAGANTGINWNQANKIFWFAPGVHTLGVGEYNQIEPGSGSTYVGAPGAILDGQMSNRYAFTQHATNVTIRYLTIKNFNAPRDEGVINHDAGKGWTVEYSTAINNKGAAFMMGRDNTYRYNCMKDNGQYAINACCDLSDTAAGELNNLVVDHNEIVGNNTDDWETKVEGCGCTGGIKFWLANNITVTNNWVHHNHGPGFWFDNNNRGARVENNYINDNESQAIFAEAGYDYQIRYNNIIRNAIKEGSSRGTDPFPIGAIYISESGSPTGYGIKYVPSVVSYNNFENNWGGVELWENPDRYSGSSAHTHVSGTIKIGNLYDDAACDGTGDTIPAAIGDKYKCRWSTENVIIENNIFKLDAANVANGCTASSQFCGVNGIFSTYGSYPEFSAFTIPWRVTFQQGNIFRNNQYYGPWKFSGWEASNRTTWANWTATPATAVPANTSAYTPPTKFGQDQGSTFSATIPSVSPTPLPSATPTATPVPTATPTPTATPVAKQGDINLDGTVNVFDLSILLSKWNQSGSADINKDGITNVFDLSILLSKWG